MKPERRKSPAPGNRGEARKHAGKRSRNSTLPMRLDSCLIRYKPPKGRALAIRLTPAQMEMLQALRPAPVSRVDLANRRPRLGLSGPQYVERLRKAGLVIDTRWVHAIDRNGNAVRYGRYCLRGSVLSVNPNSEES